MREQVARIGGMGRKVRLLSLDGGGIRGILPGVILTHLETLLRERQGDDKRIADYFELIAGTSTGGILSCGYLVPGSDGRPRYHAREVLDIYLERGNEVFGVSLLQSLTTGRGVWAEKYEADSLERALSKFFGDSRLSDLLKPCLITAYDIRNRRTKFFNSTDGSSRARNFFVKDVARATSAAPTYFETSMVRSELGVPYAMIDGGVFANNPSMCAYSEARTLDFAEVFDDPSFPTKPSAKDMMILSIGTGRDNEPYHFDDAKDWGKIGWVRPVLDIMMSAASEVVHYQLKQMFRTLEPEDAVDYLRLEPELHDARPDMDDTSQENVVALHEAGLKYIADHEGELERVVDRLIELNEPLEPATRG